MKSVSAKARIIRKRELLTVIGIASSTLYDWLNPKSPRYDPTFPKQIKLGASTVGWFSEEIDHWIEARAAARHLG